MKMLLYIFKKSTPAGQGLIFEMQLMEYLKTASNENILVLKIDTITYSISDTKRFFHFLGSSSY